jgi:hypothetical protein
LPEVKGRVDFRWRVRDDLPRLLLIFLVPVIFVLFVVAVVILTTIVEVVVLVLVVVDWFVVAEEHAEGGHVSYDVAGGAAGGAEAAGAAAGFGSSFFGGGYVDQKWRPHFGHTQN